MANYNKSTNFTAKDSLPTGNSGKIVKGTEIDIELNAIANAIASKADINSPNLTGTPTAPTAGVGTATTQLATTAFVTAALSAIYPVGSIYVNAAVSTNPATLLGFGTWEAFGAGRMMVGFNSSDSLFDTLEETGGSKDAVVASHSHTATSTVTDPQHAHNSSAAAFVSTGGNAEFGGLGQGALFNDQGGISRPSATASASTGISVATTVASAGVSATNANLPPYITVRMWKRTA
jgi:hypothetical protein